MFKPSVAYALMAGVLSFAFVNTASAAPFNADLSKQYMSGDKAAYLAKKALIRPLNKRNDEKFYSDLEEELLETINKLGIGPQGFGGKTTALGLNIETYPTHIAGLPVAVNINCHATRHKEREI